MRQRRIDAYEGCLNQCFFRCLKKLHATKGEIEALEAAIVANPRVGDVIRGLGGIRKIRSAMGGKGKRGGGRVVCFLLMADETILMLTADRLQ